VAVVPGGYVTAIRFPTGNGGAVEKAWWCVFELGLYSYKALIKVPMFFQYLNHGGLWIESFWR
jgi:hypothetical protein